MSIMKKKIIFIILLYILNITYTWAASKIFINNTSVDDVKSKLIDSFLSSDFELEKDTSSQLSFTIEDDRASLKIAMSLVGGEGTPNWRHKFVFSGKNDGVMMYYYEELFAGSETLKYDKKKDEKRRQKWLENFLSNFK